MRPYEPRHGRDSGAFRRELWFGAYSAFMLMSTILTRTALCFAQTTPDTTTTTTAADATNAANAAANGATDGPRIEIDPAASEAIRVLDPSPAPSPAPMSPEPVDVKGPVQEVLAGAVPRTGLPTVDGAINTLTHSLGTMIDGVIAMLPQLVLALLVLIATWALVNLADRLVSQIMVKARLRESLRDLMRIAVRMGVWFGGLVVAAGIVFPGFGFAQLVATAGLASIAIGFAFQNIFENFFAGILILWRFPFENGDFIEVDGIKGRVEDVEVRMTLIRQTDGDLVLVPNSTIFRNNVIVYTNRPNRRIETVVGVAYGESVTEAREVILQAVKACSTVAAHPAPEVLATAFGSSSIDFDVLWYTGNKPIDERRSRAQVIEAIKTALDDAGIEIPYPYRTLVFSPNEPDIINAVSGRAGGGASPDTEAGA